MEVEHPANDANEHSESAETHQEEHLAMGEQTPHHGKSSSPLIQYYKFKLILRLKRSLKLNDKSSIYTEKLALFIYFSLYHFSLHNMLVRK